MTAWTMDTASEEVAAGADRLRRELVRDPLLLRYAVEGRVVQPMGHMPSVRTPRAVLGEQRATALSLLHGKVPVRVNGTVRPDLNDLFGVLMANASPLLWLNKIQALAWSYDLPRHIVGEINLPQELMYWTFEGSVPRIVRETGEELTYVMDAALLMETRAGMRLAVLQVGPNQRLGILDVYDIRRGMRYPEDFAGWRAWIGQFLGAIAFLNSPYVELGHETTHRTGAKAKWHGRRIGDPQSIAVVRLRSSIHEAVAVEQGQGPRWKQRWLVRGHYRAQWYSSRNEHKIIWIAPYLKGPDDAPLKQPVYEVVR
jgi:hypothetical protein